MRKYHQEREYSAPRGWGAWTPGTLGKVLRSVGMPGPNAPRPYPYFSFWVRLQQAWDVFKYRADALYWKEPTPAPNSQEV